MWLFVHLSIYILSKIELYFWCFLITPSSVSCPENVHYKAQCVASIQEMPIMMMVRMMRMVMNPDSDNGGDDTTA